MSHTPGPWKVTDRETFYTIDNDASVLTDTEIARLRKRNLRDHANARLISEAPNMLKVLKRVHYAILDQMNGEGPDWWSIKQDVEEAIHRAKGE
jgi:hypothetical protein